MTMKVRDNSADDPVQGYVCDVTYCLEIPMVVKWEKADEDDDLKIVGVTPATKNIVDVLKVKTEEKTPPLSLPQKGAGSEPQKNMAEDKSTPPNKDMTGDNDSSPKKNTTDTEDKSTAHDEDEDMTEDNAVCPPKVVDTTEGKAESPENFRDHDIVETQVSQEINITGLDYFFLCFFKVCCIHCICGAVM